jgi:hypothetical protein
MFSIFFFENCAVYEIMWKNIVQPDRPQMTIWSTRIACWIPKATDTHSECVILLVFRISDQVLYIAVLWPLGLQIRRDRKF